MPEEKYVIEHETVSGFVLEITPLPPYYGDIIEDVLPFKDYPRRVIELHAGDTYTEEYEPPDEKPDEDDEDYGLWIHWHEVDDYNEKIGVLRARAKRDLLLSLCINIKEGPIDIDDEDWMIDLEAPFASIDYTVPEEPGQLKLLFLKYIILSHTDDVDAVMNLAMFREVSLQGIGRALHGFRGDVGSAASNGGNIVEREEPVGS